MKISTDVLAILDRSSFSGNAMVLPAVQLDRKLYVEVAKVVEAAGGKWNRKARAHVFEGDAAEAIEPIILTGEVVSAKQEFGFFESPAPVVARLMEIAELRAGMIVLEPSAGRGAIACSMMRVGVEVHTVERLAANVVALQRLGLKHVLCGDFLEQDVTPVYHRIVMNPPFSKRADVRHVLHAIKFLRPGGRLVSVMSAGVEFRADALTTELRRRIEEGDGQIQRLPEDSFKSSGTSVNTVLISLERTAI